MPVDVPNGSADAPIEVAPQTVIGINLGNAFASIAVLNKEGQAECIANEDGERQIACAISFHGEETYIGNEARHHFVKNSANTITGFRNLLGKKFSEIPKDQPTSSAPVIQHPEQPDTPAYRVQVLAPAPTPLASPPASALTTKTNTPAASAVATPRSEPTPAERILTPADATTLFLRALLASAEAFLGRPVDGAVLTAPAWFAPAQLAALQAAAEAAGIRVLQLLEDAGAASLCAQTAAGAADAAGVAADRTQLVVDLGASSLALALLSVRQGLVHHLAPPAHHTDVGGDALDERLLRFFAKDFTKKTRVPLAPGTPDDARAEARLRLALLHTKRTVAAGGGGGAAACAVESLKDGLDYTGSINRLRFDMEAAPVYAAVVARAAELLAQAGLDWLHVDEVVYAGGTACLPGLDAVLAARLREDARSPFAAGTVAGGGAGDPTTLLARGAALQARLLARVGDARLRAAFAHGSTHAGARATARTVGVLFPSDEPGAEGLGGAWVGALLRDTAVPARRTYAVEVAPGRVGLEVWEVREGVRIDTVKPPRDADYEPDEDEEEEEEEEEIEVRERTVEKGAFLGALALDTRGASRVEVQILVGSDGRVEVTARAGEEKSALVVEGI
ncbi:Hsp70 protein-domain-containing protein [Gloeopeniophorella convolvens]|nr:Hsp70 protein-domain-containing protein [Gloeopeniophorella convolvens]